MLIILCQLSPGETPAPRKKPLSLQKVPLNPWKMITGTYSHKIFLFNGTKKNYYLKNIVKLFAQTFLRKRKLADILIADDDPEILRLLKMALNLEGHDVAVARDGQEAVNLAKQKRFDVIITDIIMPRKEGIETIMEIKTLYPAVKIIAISGGGRKGKMDFLRMAEMVGACDVLAKPFRPKDLLAKVENCLAS